MLSWALRPFDGLPGVTGVLLLERGVAGGRAEGGLISGGVMVFAENR